MTDISDDFELHLTAEEHGLKFSHVVLDRGIRTSQPMLTVRGSGLAGMSCTRFKV